MKLMTVIENVWDFSWRMVVLFGGAAIIIHAADVMGVLR